MLEFEDGVKYPPVKAVIYGTEGIGKSTLASKAIDPVFIDTEGGTARMKVRRLKAPTSWEHLIAEVNEVATTPGICRTLVIDTVDWAEALAIQDICKKKNVGSIGEIRYGNGYIYLEDAFKKLVAALDQCIAAGIHVIVIAHAERKKIEQPEERGAYDHWELKLSRRVAPLLTEWADLLLFLNYKTRVVTTENGTKKAQDEKRVMFANHRSTFNAKNRFGLPDELDLDFENIRHIFEMADTNANACNTPTPLERLRSLMVEASISDDEIKGFVAAQGYAPPDQPVDKYPVALVDWIIENMGAIVTHIRAQ